MIAILTPIEENLLAATDGRGAERIDSPNWAAARFRWEHYVPRSIREAWPLMSHESRLVAYVCAAEVLSSDDSDLGSG